MKRRKGLQRKTPLARGESQLKRSPLFRGQSSLKRTRLNRVSAKTRSAKQEAGPWRKAFVSEVVVCQCCGERPAVSVHEMTPGANRQKAIHYREACLALCEDDPIDGELGCHGILQSQPLSLQLAIKLAADPDHYDRALVLEIKGWAPTAITQEEVEQWLNPKPKPR